MWCRALWASCCAVLVSCSVPTSHGSVVLCNRTNKGFDIQIDFENRKYRTKEIIADFEIAETKSHITMLRPLLISVPTTFNDFDGERWRASDYEFQLDRDGGRTKISVREENTEIVPSYTVFYDFDELQSLAAMTIAYDDGNVEIYQVCRGKITVALFQSLES